MSERTAARPPAGPGSASARPPGVADAREVARDPLLERLRAHVGRPVGPPRRARDPVNLPMIRHWCDAMGDANPVYTDPEAAARSVHGGIVAPPTMLQAWVMRGLEAGGPPNPGSPSPEVMALLDEAGYTSVVATDCEQVYLRYLRPGDVVEAASALEAVSERKRTALGDGYFLTVATTYTVDGEEVGRQRFGLLKFRPREVAADPARRPRPAVSADTEFFWEGCRRGELLIQRCAACGRLRHPPRPACGECGSLDWDAVRSSGRGEVFSFVVHHHPPVPGFEVPYVVALVALEEGTRLVSNLVDVAPEDVRIGMPVEVSFLRVDETLTLPVFRPRG
jgi:uncharacterized OB-fold protein/acyl dehydratase